MSVASDSATPSSEVRDFGPPFNRETADVIIRSEDNVDFRVSRAILAEASEFFRGLFATATVDNTRDGLPIVAVEEKCTTVNHLLQLVYPMDNPVVKDVLEIEALLRALDKYLITTFPRTVEEFLRNAMERSPHMTFAVALKYNMRKVAHDAAIETLRKPLFFTEGPVNDNHPLFRLITSEKFSRLMRYHYDCVREATAVVRNMAIGSLQRTIRSTTYPCVMYPALDPPSTQAQSVSCTCIREAGTERLDGRTINFTVPTWVTTFLRKCETKLNERPHWKTLETGLGAVAGIPNWHLGLETDDILGPPLEEIARCRLCRFRAKDELLRFRARVVIAVQDGITRVRTNISCRVMNEPRC